MRGRNPNMITAFESLDKQWCPEPYSGCWLWIGNINPNGYGKVWIKPRHHGAHRVMWEQHNGKIPNGLWVLHRCDTPLCVNPNHLFLGTFADNLADRMCKSRTAKGERAGKSKLTQAQVLQIKTEAGLHREIAARYGINENQVSRIKGEKTWRHLWQKS